MRKPGFLSFRKLAVILDQASKSPKETLSKLSNASNNPIYLEKESNLNASNGKDGTMSEVNYRTIIKGR